MRCPKILILCLCSLIFLFPFNTVAQSNDLQIEYKKEDLKVNSLTARNPAKLVEALTGNKSGDKEKFDAIYAWVANNISYNYKTYYSSNGTGKPDIKRVLKSKSGICMDYAALMDTLCELAGIKSVSVYGYAKDEIFDVNDSLYIDNHAWNAVRLDGLWYVYDVTWSSGTVDYKLKRFSRFLVRLYNKIPVKYKKRKIKNKFFYMNKDVCAPEYFAKSKPSLEFYEKRMRFPLLVKFITSFKLKAKAHYNNDLDTNYYLCNPELFAKTHFPDNPIWSLITKRNVQTVETDSSFYHLADSLYRNQQRRGATCPECDVAIGYNPLEANKYLHKQSFAFNRKNGFITSMCEFNISEIKFYESIKAEDSLAKVTLIDTSLAYVDLAKKSLDVASKGVNTDFSLQKTKNRRKMSLLKDDNTQHTKFIKGIADKTVNNTKNLKGYAKKRVAVSKKYVKRNNALGKYKTDIETNKSTKTDPIIVNDLKTKLAGKTKTIDSLNLIIASLRLDFEGISATLYEKIWKRANEYDSLINPFRERIYYRSLMQDEYKKRMVETKKKIYTFEKNYSTDLDSNLYNPTQRMIATNQRIFDLIELRDKKRDDCLQLIAKQVKLNHVSGKNLVEARVELILENQDDFCWLQSENSNLLFSYTGYQVLKNRQVLVKQYIKLDNKVEKYRHDNVSDELKRRQKKYKNIVNTNKKVVKAQTKNIKKYKRDYLAMLKEEAKKNKEKK